MYAFVVVVVAILAIGSAEARVVTARILSPEPLTTLDDRWRLEVDGEVVFDDAGLPSSVAAQRLRLEILDGTTPVLTLTEADDVGGPDYPAVSRSGLQFAAFAVTAKFADLGSLPVNLVVDGEAVRMTTSTAAGGLSAGTTLAWGEVAISEVPLPAAAPFAITAIGFLVGMRALRRRVAH